MSVLIMKKEDKKYKLNAEEIKKARDRFSSTYQLLDKTYPEAHCALLFKNPLQLLIATILSAQCTDKRVNMVTPALFKKYPTVKSFAQANLGEVQEMIRSTGYFRNKAKNIIAACQRIEQIYEGKVPDKMRDLITLPGVARKTANVVLWNAFGVNDGVVVDTHVSRISQRLGWTGEKTTAKIERDLMKLTPQENWGKISHLLIDLGRDVCKAPVPVCLSCKLNKFCPSFPHLKKNK